MSRYVLQCGKAHQHHELPDDAAALRKAHELAALRGARVRVFRDEGDRGALEIGSAEPPRPAGGGRVH